MSSKNQRKQKLKWNIERLRYNSWKEVKTFKDLHWHLFMFNDLYFALMLVPVLIWCAYKSKLFRNTDQQDYVFGYWENEQF